MPTPAVKNNNPGNLKDPSTGTFRTFKSPQEGYAALLNDLQAKQTGTTTTGLGPSSSLVDFASKYAPAGDKNNVGKYAANLANQMGVRPDSKLKDLDLGKWAAAVAHNEDTSSLFGNQKIINQPKSPTATNFGKEGIAMSPLNRFAAGDTKGVLEQSAGALGALKGDNPFIEGMIANSPGMKKIETDTAALPETAARRQGEGQTAGLGFLAVPAEGANAVADSAALATKRLASSAGDMSGKQLENQASRILPSGKMLPSATEQRAGEILKGQTSRNPVKTLKSVNGEIAKQGKGAETYLEKNAVPISNQEDFKAFDSARKEARQYLPESERKFYDEQINLFQGILKKYGKYDTSNYYKALKEYEKEVTANIPRGKDALLMPGGNARVRAAKDVREVVRKMIGEKNPEFNGKMFDLASLYDVKDTVLGQVADLAKSKTNFSNRHPVVSGILKGAASTGVGLGLGLLGLPKLQEAKDKLGL